jgi:GTPase SAR1 family protein
VILVNKRCRFDLFLSFVNMDPRLVHPFTAIICGPSGSGKTIFTFKLIKEASKMIYPPPEKIVYCYGEFLPIFNEYPEVTFSEGLPDIGQFDGSQRTLLIIDDLLSETNDLVSNLFTKVSHHRSVSIVYLSQNLFYRSKQNRTMSLNAHYTVLFKNPRDANQVSVLARQMYPGKSKFMLEAFKDATEKPYGYLLIDFKPETDEKLRVRTNIFTSDSKHYVYVPK